VARHIVLLEIQVAVRTRADHPLAKVATDPKRYQVTFLSAKLADA
jgi:hypothetical protein